MKIHPQQINLFEKIVIPRQPTDYSPICPEYFNISQIFLAQGSMSTSERRRFVNNICKLFSGVKITECPDIPHNRINLNKRDMLALHYTGKRVLVFGELKSAVRFSEEQDNSCPNYWHFSPYGFCPYGCKYCYLAGTQGVKFSPTVKIYVNLPDMLQQINRIAMQNNKIMPFYLGKLQDPLALDPLTKYSSIYIPFFTQHPFARLILLTKSTNIENVLNLDHHENTVLSWSVNPPEICKIFEENVPSIEERLEVMKLAVSKGYPVRAVMMPIIPIDNWQNVYSNFIKLLLEKINIQRLTLGGICTYSGAQKLMEQKMGIDNPISTNIDRENRSKDGRARYSLVLRKQLYSFIINEVKSFRPDLRISLCLEEETIWQQLGIAENLGYCNCML